MGNHHGIGHGQTPQHRSSSSPNNSGGESSAPGSASVSRNGSKKLTRSQSGADLLHDKGGNRSQMLPLEILAKILAQKSHQEEGLANGIGLHTFSRYLFPRYPILAEKFYHHLNVSPSKKPNHGISTSTFKNQCDKFFLLSLEDERIPETLVHMFGETNTCNDGMDENCTLSTEALRSLLMVAYHISMDHYSEGPQMCLTINKTLSAVVDSCYHGKDTLSAQYVAHWLQANCPRLLNPIYRYAVHSLATSYRTLENPTMTEDGGAGPSLAAVTDKDGIETEKGLELATPVLDQPPPFGNKPPHPHLLQMSMSWLLAGALPPLYSRPQKAHSPSSSAVGLSSAAFMSKLLCAVPSHWLCLYDSDAHGLGCNRFLHHVLAYRGATLCFIRTDSTALFCIAAPCEWKESHLYWGGEESAVYQIMPKFQLLEKGSKLLYLNPSVRGYPLGLRAGSDPRNPIIVIDGGFEKMEFRKIPYSLQTIEVWGCGDATSRDVQLDIKKWQVKEAERQKNVKLSAAEWQDHPDRYLLELVGRPQYNNQHLENCN